MLDVIVRNLTCNDIATMRGMSAMFAKAFAESETYLGNPPSDAYLSGLLSKNHFITIAALAHDTVVGGLVAYQLDKFEQDRREIYIYDLAVEESFRRRGIATALIEALRAEARLRTAYVIFVQADLQDRAAIALYAKLGAQETAHHFDITPIDTPPPQRA